MTERDVKLQALAGRDWGGDCPNTLCIVGGERDDNHADGLCWDCQAAPDYAVELRSE